MLVIVAKQEGLFTTVFGLLSLLWIPATPSAVGLLTPHEREVYIRALAEDWSGDVEGEEGEDHEQFSWSEVWSVVINAPHVLLICIPLFGLGLTVSVNLS